MSVIEISAVGTPAITLTEAKAFARIDGTAQDGEILTMLEAFTVEAEHKTGRVLAIRTYRITLDEFAPAIDVPLSPVAYVTAINYVDSEGIERTLTSSAYYLDRATTPPQVKPISTWPATAGNVMIDVACGYGDGAIPAGFRAYIGAKLAEHFAQPGSPKSPYLDNLIQPYKAY